MTLSRLKDKIRSLAFKYPEIANSWHKIKNGRLTPDKVTAHSGIKAWWFCENGHEWESSIFNRTSGRGCPYCAGKIATDQTSLLSKFPKIAAEWHPTRNKTVTPNNVMPMSCKNVWWKCSNGHEWKAPIQNRVRDNYNCPLCIQVKHDWSKKLSSQFPKIAQSWHPNKNGVLRPEDVSCRSGKVVWWLCEKGHEYLARISSRTRGRACPYCKGKKVLAESSLSAKFPKITAEWNIKRNGKIGPDKVMPMSGKTVWWMCIKKHEWKTKISTRVVSNSRCPYCAGKYVTPETSLAAIKPELIKEWDKIKNKGVTPYDVFPKSNKKMWWKCYKNHSWFALISSRSNGKGCPICFNLYRRGGGKKTKTMMQNPTNLKKYTKQH